MCCHKSHNSFRHSTRNAPTCRRLDRRAQFRQEGRLDCPRLSTVHGKWRAFQHQHQQAITDCKWSPGCHLALPPRRGQFLPTPFHQARPIPLAMVVSVGSTGMQTGDMKGKKIGCVLTSRICGEVCIRVQDESNQPSLQMCHVANPYVRPQPTIPQPTQISWVSLNKRMENARTVRGTSDRA